MYASKGLGKESRKCNVKEEVNIPRINHFLEKWKISASSCCCLFLWPPPTLGNRCLEVTNTLGTASLSLGQIRHFSRTGPFNILGLFFSPDNCQLDDNPYLVTGPFIMWMLGILGDNVLQFFRQGETETRRSEHNLHKCFKKELRGWLKSTVNHEK